MKHRSTIAIFGEWQRLAFENDRSFGVPQRENIKPRRLGRHLSNLFFAEYDSSNELVFRLGGTDICTLFGRELKGQRFHSLWPEHDRPALMELGQNITSMHIPALSYHKGISLSGRNLHFEMLLAPLRDRNGQMNLLGALAVLDTVSWIGADPLVLGHLGTIEPIAPDTELAQENPVETSQVVNARPYQRIWTEPQALDHAIASKPRLQLIKGGKA
ncbi:PAS domain-containing protein [Brucella sp. BE17]|uniref:PAS domain-containing protein n=1 Tax=Brucella sp. BE17 TaxID=3142977 RepID=UPI0031BBA7D9